MCRGAGVRKRADDNGNEEEMKNYKAESEWMDGGM